MKTETVQIKDLQKNDVVRLPDGNAEVVFIKVTPKMARVTYKRDGYFGGRMKNDTMVERFVR